MHASLKKVSAFSPPVISFSLGGSSTDTGSEYLHTELICEGKAPGSLSLNMCFHSVEYTMSTTPEYSNYTMWQQRNTQTRLETNWVFVTNLVTGSHSDLSLCAVQSPEKRQRTFYYKFCGKVKKLATKKNTKTQQCEGYAGLPAISLFIKRNWINISGF